jgi:hypothetical protein
VKKTESGLLHHPDGRVERIIPQDGKKFKLEELQKAVGGSIELVPGTGRRGKPSAYCNEEGRLDNLPFNFHASIKFNCDLCGPVLQVERS